MKNEALVTNIPRPYLKFIISILIPFFALGVQWVLWPYIAPFVWFLFFPAVFFSARLGRFKGGLISTVISGLIVIYFFMPPQLSWEVQNPYNLYSVVMFLSMGYLFSDIQERFHKANETTKQALQQTRAANEKITHLYEKTRELDELKTQFFANISHELRTPLTLILGPLQKAIQSLKADNETRSNLEVVQRNANFLHRQVNDLLDVSKLNAGHMTVRYSKVDLAYFTRMVASQFNVLADERKIKFDIGIHSPCPAEVDTQKYQRILLNLLSNAFKFTPDDGKISVELKAEQDSAVITVSDSGPGIPSGQRQIIFERFHQLEGGASRQYGGTGLGLSITKDFIELHHGSVEVTDSPAGGAMFTVRLPLSAPNGAPVEAIEIEIDDKVGRQLIDELLLEHAVIPDPQNSINTNAPLILVVEDSPDMNAFISSALSKQYRVAAAANGQIGLEKAIALKPDLILTDIMMPVMSGDQMALAIRKHEELRNVPIVVLTAKTDEQLRLTMLRAGVQDFINKPFKIDELLARIHNLLESANLLQATSDQFNHLIHISPIPYAINDEAQNITYLNPAFVKTFGYQLEDIPTLAEWWPKAYPDPEYRRWVAETWQARLRRSKAEGTDFEPMEIKIHAKDGSIKTVLASAAPLSSDYGGNHLVILYNITERIEVEEQLRRIQKLLTDTEKIGSVGGWEFNIDTQEQVWTEEIYRIHEIDTELPPNVPSGINFYAPESRPVIERAVQNAVEYGEPFDEELEIITARGNRRWVHAIGMPDLENRRVYGFFQDITRSKTLELEREQYFRLFNTSNDLMVIADPNGAFLKINPACSKVLGYSEQELVSRAFIDFVHPEDRQSTLNEMVRQQKAGSSLNFENRYLCKDGSIKWLSWRATYIDAEKTTYATARDNTDQKRAEEALRESQRRLNFIASNTPDHIVLHDKNLHYLFVVNPQLGLTAEEMIGKSDHDLLSKEEADRLVAAKKQVMSSGEPLHFATSLRSRNGGTEYFDGTFVPTLDLGGQVDGLIGYFRNVTEIKRNEAVLHSRIQISEYADTHSLDEILQMTLDQAEELSGSTIGFAHFLKADQKTLHLQMWSTNTIKNMCTAEGKNSHYAVDQAGVWVDAVHQRRPVIHNDYASLAHKKGMPEGHAPVTRELVVPVIRNEKIVMIMGVGNKPDDYTELDQEYVSQIANLSWDIIQRKKAELGLQAASEYNRRLIEASLDPLVTIGPDGTITDVNEATELITGVRREQLIGNEFPNFFTDPEKARAGYLIVLATGSVKDYPLTIRHISGATREVLYNASVYRDENGEIEGVFAAARDITQSKQAEEILKESEKRFSTAFFITPVSQSIIARDSLEIMAVNDACCRLFGYSREELLGYNTAKLSLWQDPQQRQAAIEELAEKGNLSPRETDIRTKNGELRTVMVAIEPIFWQGRDCLMSSILDISDRKQAEEALRASENFAYSVLNSLTAHIAVLNNQGDIIAVNESWKRFAEENGCTDPQAYLSTNYLTACATAMQSGDELANQVDLGIRAVLSGLRSSFTSEYPCDSPSQQRWFSITVVPQHHPQQGVIVIHQDITVRKQAQQSLEASHLILKNALELEKQLARTDPLTGINNRRYLFELAEHEIEISSRYKQPLSVLMFDIDHFKKFNDTYGHKVGDLILKEVANTARNILRSADIIGRYGGEEFIILLPLTGAEQAFRLAERIRIAVENMSVDTDQGPTSVTLSIGIVERDLGNTRDTIEDLFHRADEAMYRAKADGRNRTAIGD